LDTTTGETGAAQRKKGDEKDIQEMEKRKSIKEKIYGREKKVNYGWRRNKRRREKRKKRI